MKFSYMWMVVMYDFVLNEIKLLDEYRSTGKLLVMMSVTTISTTPLRSSCDGKVASFTVCVCVYL